MASALTQTCRFVAALFAVCVCAGSLVSSSPTVTVTVSQWTTTTTISPKMTYGICASLISASEPCPVITKKIKTSTKADKKKKKKEETTTTPPLVPVYVAFDDELHEYLLEYFEPSAVVKVQTTATAKPVTEESNSPPIESSSADSTDTLEYLSKPYVMNQLDRAVKKVLGMTETITKTERLTKTKTSTFYVTTTVKTFILENCIPSKFNFTTCS